MDRVATGTVLSHKRIVYMELIEELLVFIDFSSGTFT